MKPCTNHTRKMGLACCIILCRQRMLHLILCIAFTAAEVKAQSQCISTGATNASIFSNDITEGTIAFINPAFAQYSDASRSIASTTLSNPAGSSNYLKATGFNFSIPPGSTICSVYAEIQKSAAGTDNMSSVTDAEVKLVKGGLIVGENAALQGSWPSTDTYFAYGNNSDVWNVNLTPADVNDPGFGIIISAKIKNAGSSLPSALINHIRLYINYSVQLLPVMLLSFDVVRKNNNYLYFKWTVTGEEEVSWYVIEESTGTTSWSSVYQTGPMHKSSYEAELPFPDNRTRFYRLHIYTKDGGSKYSAIKNINEDLNGQSFSIFTDRNAGNIRLSNMSHTAEAVILNMQGMKVLRTTLPGGITNRIDISTLPRGLYVLRIENFSYKFAW